MDKYLASQSNEPIHSWFELSYCSYLVLPRSVLQSAPIELQSRFVKCLEELEELFGCVPDKGSYEVHLRDSETHKYISDDLANYARGRRQIPFKEAS